MTALLASVALLLGVSAPVARAATATDSYGYIASFGGGSIVSSPLDTPQFNALAVDRGTGNILVPAMINELYGYDPTVSVYSPDPVAGGTLLTAIDLAPVVPGIAPLDAAVDQTDGSLYLADQASRRIFKLVSDGAPVPTYTLDPSFSSPPSLFSGLAGIAVVPVTHDVLVGDRNTHLVHRLDSTGALVSSFDGSNSSGGAFKNVASLAVGPTGTVYVVDEAGARVERFSAAGASLGPLPLAPGSGPRSIAVNPQTGEVAVLVNRQGGPLFLEGFTAAGQLEFSSRFPAQVPGDSIGLAWDSGTDRIYMNTLNGTVYTFVPSKQPGLDAPVISQVTPTSAHVKAQVAPGGVKANARIEYCPTTAACANYPVSNPSDPSNPWVRLPDHKELEGGGEETIEDDLTGLNANFNYLVRASAENTLTGETSPTTPLHTVAIPPETTTNEATDVSETSAVLNGTINPVDLPSTYHFEYGTTTAYGSRAPAGIEAVAGADRKDRRVGRTIVGLAPGVTYHFRLVAQNSAGANQGADRVFTTAGVGGVLQRAYEQVTPVDKGGIAIKEGAYFQAKADGSAISYAAEASPASAPLGPRLMSLRGAADWTGGIGLDPPYDVRGQVKLVTLGVSADFTHSLVASNRKLTPDAIEDGPERANIYLVDLTSGAHALVASAPGGFTAFTNQSASFVAGASDFSWVVFTSVQPLRAGAPNYALYRWSAAGGLEVVSTLPDGEEEGVYMGTQANVSTFARSVSADGSRIYFTGGKPEAGLSKAGLCLWEAGAPTKTISISHVPGDPATPHRATLIGSGEDGRYVFFFSSGKLTADAPNPGSEEANVYRYDASDESLEYLGASLSNGNGLDFLVPMGVGDDGQTAYWEGPNGSGTRVWRDGVLTTATPSGVGSDGSASLSPDGRYFAYAVGEVTSVSPPVVGNIYLYDAETDQTSCASCLPDGSLGTGYISQAAWFLRLVSNRNEQAVTNSGQVFFTSAARLVATDVNGSKDVYEFKDGQNTLISPGDAPFDAILGDISEDGSNVFFTTPQKLVGQDNDKSVDLYDARINGGLAKQNPPPPQECVRDDCKATPNAGPELPFGGSEALSGPGNVSGEARKRCAKGTHARKVKGKTRCVKASKAKKKAKNAKRANTNRRQGR